MPAFRNLTCAVLLAVAALSAWADVGREDAAAIAQRVTPGRVLAVERGIDVTTNRPAWRVKVLTANGDVRLVLVDMATGRPS